MNPPIEALYWFHAVQVFRVFFTRCIHPIGNVSQGTLPGPLVYMIRLQAEQPNLFAGQSLQCRPPDESGKGLTPKPLS